MFKEVIIKRKAKAEKSRILSRKPCYMSSNKFEKKQSYSEKKQRKKKQKKSRATLKQQFNVIHGVVFGFKFVILTNKT